MLRASHDRPGGAFLHDATEIHDRDPLRKASRRGEVVRDHQDRETLAAQAVEDVEDARAYRDIQHGDRFVGNEHLGLEDERRGDRDPLALATGELVRKAVEVELGRRKLHTASGVEPPACVLVEPIQGNGGVVIPPAGFLAGLRRLCDRTGTLLVFDEIQCGFGRSGRMWASDHEGVVPDLMTVGKGSAEAWRSPRCSAARS
jgi:adenosylmethionine-8-amino-7-oxononanoate aminotransferase